MSMMKARLLLVCVLSACGADRAATPSPPPSAAPAPLEAAPVPAAAVDAGARPKATAEPPPGYVALKVEDSGPLCVFAGHDQRADAERLQDARKQKLVGNQRVVFGTYAPACISEACDRVPTHQCWVDTEGSTLVVHSKLSYEHKQGATCTTDCAPVVAGCETEPLQPGKYAVKYGERTFELKIPSVMQDPCFARK